MGKREDFYQRLDRLRVAAELDLTSLAAEVGVSRQSVSDWCNRGIWPSSRHLVALADALGVSLDELLRGEP